MTKDIVQELLKKNIKYGTPDYYFLERNSRLYHYRAFETGGVIVKSRESFNVYRKIMDKLNKAKEFRVKKFLEKVKEGDRVFINFHPKIKSGGYTVESKIPGRKFLKVKGVEENVDFFFITSIQKK